MIHYACSKKFFELLNTLKDHILKFMGFFVILKKYGMEIKYFVF